MNRKTKIVCTIGPSTDNVAMLEKMCLAGMNVARINFSHGSSEEYLQKVKNIREASKNVNRPIAIMLDTKGPEIRTGDFENGMVQFKKGDIVNIVKEDVIGTKEAFTVSYKDVFGDLKVNDTILIDDGKMNLTVLEANSNLIKCQINNNGPLKSKKGVNIPNVKLKMPFLSQKDLNDITFGVENNFDIIALSFVRTRNDVLEVKDLIKKLGKDNIEIIAKIENQEGFDNLREILEVSDGVMVARGDLGVEVSSEAVPIYQKKMIKMANEFGKPVITATHMLESMISNPRPTRAEASDVANAILDGSDAIMLSGESAIGDYPIESVKVMDTIARNVEEIIPYQKRLFSLSGTSQNTINDAIGICVSQTALTLENVGAIVAFTQTGGSAKRIAKFRPKVPIIACTDNWDTYNKINLYWGVYPIVVNHVDDFTKYDSIACEVAKKYGLQIGSKIIITSGYKQDHGTTNSMRIIEVI